MGGFPHLLQLTAHLLVIEFSLKLLAHKKTPPGKVRLALKIAIAGGVFEKLILQF
ncbi:MAG: hypothetical protein HP060_01335 [Opitutales bacterium]|nr:hypothetical protein [Opitutales bacterium]